MKKDLEGEVKAAYFCVRSFKKRGGLSGLAAGFFPGAGLEEKIYLVGNQFVTYLCGRFLREGGKEEKGWRTLFMRPGFHRKKKSRKDLEAIAVVLYLCSPQNEKKQFFAARLGVPEVGWVSLLKE